MVTVSTRVTMESSQPSPNRPNREKNGKVCDIYMISMDFINMLREFD